MKLGRDREGDAVATEETLCGRTETIDRRAAGVAVHLPAGTELVVEYDAGAPLRPSSVLEERVSLSTLDASGRDVELVERRPNGSHLVELEQVVLHHLQIQTKAYWAPGKAGLD